MEGDLELIKEGTRRFGARDLDGAAELWAPEAIMIAPEGWPEGGPFVGREVVMRQFARVSEDWESNDIETGREAGGGEWVAMEFVWRARGRASGAEVEMRLSGAYRVRDHLIAELHLFWNYEEALAKAGLTQ